MDKETIGKALRSLPRAQARDGFRRRVLAGLTGPEGGLGEPEENRAFGMMTISWRFLSVVAAILLVVVIPLSMRSRTIRDERLARERVEALRDEYQALEQDLLDLQRMAIRSRPLVGVAGNGEYDFLIDLRNLYARSESTAGNNLGTPPAVPAFYRPGQ